MSKRSITTSSWSPASGFAVTAALLVVAPITTTHRDVPWLVEIDPPDSGLHARSWIECDQLQALAPSPLRFKTFRRRLAESRRLLRSHSALRHVLDGAL